LNKPRPSLAGAFNTANRPFLKGNAAIMSSSQRQVIVFGTLFWMMLAADLAFVSGADEAGQPMARRMRLFCGLASTHKPFAITVYIKEAGPEQTVTLHLPDGLTLTDGQQAERRVPPANEKGYSQVSWRVKASQAGKYSVRVEAPGIGKDEELVRVLEPGVI